MTELEDIIFATLKKTEEDIIQKSDSGEFQRLWDFADSDEGASALLNHFKNEVKIEDPSIFFKRAPQTDDLKELIEQSKHPVIKKLEYDLNKYSLGEYAIIFNGKFPGLATFEWLNDQLSTPNDHFKFDWGSYGDDAIYKFLSSNCTRWNNGENTRQIEIDGHRHRFYLLDDTRCPFPGKSYKDLTPKVIETIYKNFSEIRKEVSEEEDNYEKARHSLASEIEHFKDQIQWAIESANRSPASKKYKKYLDKSVDQVWEELQNGTIELDKEKEKDALKKLNEIKKYKSIIARGIRTPEEIIATYPKEKIHKSNY